MLEIVVQKKFSFLLIFQAAFVSVLECTNTADIIRHCVNFSPCIETFAHIYKALASDDNSYNIESALYPSKKPSSVRVFVNVFGPNKTDNSTTDTKYTWSLNCLYAAFPARVLEVLSVGSILVTSRTKDLNITIPQFCCNVSVEIRQKMIEDVLAALQDLAINPGIRDPRLNTADCVIEGHEPNITATGRSSYIKGVLWCTFFSVILLGPLIAFVILGTLRSHEEDEFYCPLYPCCCPKRCYYVEKPLVLSVNFVVQFLLLVEIGILITVLLNHAPKEINIFLLIISLEGVAMYIHTCFTYIFCGSSPTRAVRYCKFSQFLKQSKEVSIYRGSVFIACSNLVLYHVCWLTVGIMINPIWGLTVLLIFCLAIVAIFYAAYKICNVDECCSSLCIQRFVFLVAGFLGLCIASAVPILAAQSFYGRETADDVMNTALLYICGIFGSWKFWKSSKSSSNSSNQSNTSPATSSAHTPAVSTPTSSSASAPAPASAGPALDPAPTSVPLATNASAPNDEMELSVLGEQRRPLLP